MIIHLLGTKYGIPLSPTGYTRWSKKKCLFRLEEPLKIGIDIIPAQAITKMPLIATKASNKPEAHEGNWRCTKPIAYTSAALKGFCAHSALLSNEAGREENSMTAGRYDNAAENERKMKPGQVGMRT